MERVQERKILERGPENWQKACFIPTQSDALVVTFRRWFNKYSGAQVDWRGKFDPSLLPPMPPREQLFDRLFDLPFEHVKWKRPRLLNENLCVSSYIIFFQVLVACGELQQLQESLQVSERSWGDLTDRIDCSHWSCGRDKASDIVECSKNRCACGSCIMFCFFEVALTLHFQDIPLPWLQPCSCLK